MRFNLSISQKGLVLVIVPVIFELIFVSYLFELLQDAEHQVNVERAIKTILADSHKLTDTFYRTGKVGVYYRLTHKEAHAVKFHQGMNQLTDTLDKIEKNLHSVDANDHSFDDVKTAAGYGKDALLGFMARNELGYRQVFDQEMEKKLTKYVDEMDRFVKHEEEAEAKEWEHSSESREHVLYWLIFGVSVNIGIAVALANFFSFGTTRRLAVLMENTFRLAARKPLEKPVGGGDEIAHLDKVFHQMAQDLDDAAKRKQEMVAMVSHDLRTPLMSMQASLELLSEGVLGKLPEKAVDELNVAEYSASRLIQLINDLLDIDKLEAGKFELNKRNADIGWIFERCIKSVKAFADRYHVTIVVPEDDDDVQIYGDPDRLAQVITNLLSNAIKYSPEGGEVTVTYQELPEALLVKVIDHGRGIPPGFEDSIFERFQQVDSTDEREKKGSGLGLAICKALIDAHDGSIGVDSKVGQGSTFWFRIPKPRMPIPSQMRENQPS